jgi:hypothetical protein
MKNRQNFAACMVIASLMLAAGDVARGQQGSGRGNSMQTVGLPSGASSSGDGTAPTMVPSTKDRTPPAVPGMAAPDVGRDPLARNEDEMQRLHNNERQKKLVEDTAKLVALANELKAEVDKSDKNTLSLDVVRKADEIERLAKSVKDRMKGN